LVGIAARFEASVGATGCAKRIVVALSDFSTDASKVAGELTAMQRQ
jgi:hypothetical protein